MSFAKHEQSFTHTHTHTHTTWAVQTFYDIIYLLTQQMVFEVMCWPLNQRKFHWEADSRTLTNTAEESLVCVWHLNRLLPTMSSSALLYFLYHRSPAVLYKRAHQSQLGIILGWMWASDHFFIEDPYASQHLPFLYWMNEVQNPRRNSYAGLIFNRSYV